MLTFNKITRYGSGCSKDFRQASLLPVNKPKSGFNIMNIWGDNNYFNPNYLYPEEVFVDIPNFDKRYKISNYGRIKSFVKRGAVFHDGRVIFAAPRIMKPTIRQGYLRVELLSSDKKITIHKLVGAIFIPNNDPENRKWINHKDGIKQNNYYRNLEWCTKSENIIHAFRTGLNKGPIGEKASGSKLKEYQVKYIKSHLSDLSNNQLSKMFNVSYHTIDDIRYERTWKHININT